MTEPIRTAAELIAQYDGQGAPPWTYMESFESEGFTKCIHCRQYCLPENLLMPTGKEFSYCQVGGGSSICSPKKPICRRCWGNR